MHFLSSSTPTFLFLGTGRIYTYLSNLVAPKTVIPNATDALGHQLFFFQVDLSFHAEALTLNPDHTQEQQQECWEELERRDSEFTFMVHLFHLIWV